MITRLGQTVSPVRRQIKAYPTLETPDSVGRIAQRKINAKSPLFYGPRSSGHRFSQKRMRLSSMLSLSVPFSEGVQPVIRSLFRLFSLRQ